MKHIYESVAAGSLVALDCVLDLAADQNIANELESGSIRFDSGRSFFYLAALLLRGCRVTRALLRRVRLIGIANEHVYTRIHMFICNTAKPYTTWLGLCHDAVSRARHTAS